LAELWELSVHQLLDCYRSRQTSPSEVVGSCLDRIEALDSCEDVNTFSRYVSVKEEHAQAVKNELNILLSDYFKPEHLADYPNLHELFWNANKLAGANKQGVSSESAQQLVDAVDEIAKIFWASKGVDYSDPNAAVRYGA